MHLCPPNVYELSMDLGSVQVNQNWMETLPFKQFITTFLMRINVSYLLTVTLYDFTPWTMYNISGNILNFTRLPGPISSFKCYHLIYCVHSFVSIENWWKLSTFSVRYIGWHWYEGLSGCRWLLNDLTKICFITCISIMMMFSNKNNQWMIITLFWPCSVYLVDDHIIPNILQAKSS